MFEDKLALMEYEYKKQQDVCSNLYKKVAIQGDSELQIKYESEREKLTALMIEIKTLKELINNPIK